MRSELAMASTVNLMKAGMGVLLRPQKAFNKPVHLQIEPTTVCNLKCAFCVREKNVFRPKSIDIERFKPELVCIEASPSIRVKLLEYFAAHGYERIERYLEHDHVNWYFTPKTH